MQRSPMISSPEVSFTSECARHVPCVRAPKLDTGLDRRGAHVALRRGAASICDYISGEFIEHLFCNTTCYLTVTLTSLLKDHLVLIPMLYMPMIFSFSKSQHDNVKYVRNTRI